MSNRKKLFSWSPGSTSMYDTLESWARKHHGHRGWEVRHEIEGQVIRIVLREDQQKIVRAVSDSDYCLANFDLLDDTAKQMIEKLKEGI